MQSVVVFGTPAPMLAVVLGAVGAIMLVLTMALFLHGFWFVWTTESGARRDEYGK